MIEQSHTIAEGILALLAEWEVLDKSDPDYQLFLNDVTEYIQEVALLSQAMIDRLQAENAQLRAEIAEFIRLQGGY